MNKNSSFIWWIPTILLLIILYPMKISAFDAYISFAMPFVGIFSAWLALGFLFFFRNQKNALQWGIVFAMITACYNPVISKYTLTNILSMKSHVFGIILNVVIAGIFLYSWWVCKHQNKKDLG
jgi:hypothetical protein